MSALDFSTGFAKSGHTWTLPADWYSSEEMFTRERAEIFTKNWMLFSWSEKIPNPGDYVRGTVAGYSVFAMRGDDGVVRAFHNVCRHRGAELVAQPHEAVFDPLFRRRVERARGAEQPVEH